MLLVRREDDSQRICQFQMFYLANHHFYLCFWPKALNFLLDLLIYLDFDNLNLPCAKTWRITTVNSSFEDCELDSTSHL